MLLPILLGVLFAIAYTQSPLYTSNQNQYFLHGLAQAGFGNLKQDWLANTLDPTPVFSVLISLTYRLTQQPFLYYLYYTVLLALYLFCLVGIMDSLFNLRRSPARQAVFLALVFLAHSAALRFGLSRLIGENWTYLLEDGLADQRLLGPVFQPSAFGVLLLVSIYLFLKRKPLIAVLAAALAATIHPTYLLSAAALTLSYMLASYLEERRLGKALLIGGVALLAVTPILVYVYSSFGDTSTESSAKAQAILVNFRIPFHALISRWFDWTAIIKIALLLAGLVVLRRTRLFLVLLVPALLAALLTIAQALTQNNTLALLFPWRISTFLVPLAVAALLAKGTNLLFMRFPGWESKYARRTQAFCYTFIGMLVVVGIVRMSLDFQRQDNLPDRGVLSYVAVNHTGEQVYMVPLDMQDFRLATGAPVYVEFKSIPYQDRDVLEWARRIQNTDQFYKKSDCGSLEKIARWGITHIIGPPKLFDINCAEWQEVYRDDNYAVYALR